jgi:hypothetical protein
MYKIKQQKLGHLPPYAAMATDNIKKIFTTAFDIIIFILFYFFDGSDFISAYAGIHV